ncbi:fatty acid--CoA ligase FadD11 [Amycolatopsis benzoatilytica]|uniref:fatty acid--CoA ligase FadD11 n=1 Tax=Amycolatopsis benzoatilytica TaxID=346045 RepID=UPI000364DFE3|nr:fatty acid--CoA ligase FadD11 [Amycolatopsis benzoatilytica]
MPERPATLCEAFQRTARIDPDAIALRTPGAAQTLTWRAYAEQVRQVAAGLAALGIRRGDAVALMMGNRIEFYPLEVGAQHVGATSFSVYNTLATDQLAHVLGNAGSRLVCCEAQYVDRIRASGAEIEHLVVIDADGEAPEGTLTVADLIAGGAADHDFEAGWRAVRPHDVATLTYTSGTTGTPKGVESTHANLMSEAYGFAQVMDLEFGDRITSYLPAAHIADRFTTLYLQEVFGLQITAVADARRIAAALPDVRPTIWGGVPRVWEKLKAAIEAGVAAEPDEARRQGLRQGLAVAAKRGAAALAGTAMPDDAAAEWAEADRLVLAPLRRKIGLDQVRWAISGAAPIAAETLGFFAGLGIPIAEIWGMSELTCVASVAHPRDAKLGSVGRLLPGMEGKLTDEGELLVRGPLVMRGYRKEPEKTAEAVDAEGWLHTGDIVRRDDDGFLWVVDRKKELIINASGKNMSPANIENTIKAAAPMIGALSTIGEGRPFNTALVVLDADGATAYAAQRGMSDASAEALAEDPDVIELITAGIAAGNAKLSRVEQIRRFLVLPTFWEPGGDELTLTMKLRRKPILAKYAAEIEALYARDPGTGVHETVALQGS